MSKKIRVAILCGGRSVEHEISLISARNILSALDPSKFDVLLIGIDRQGKWHIQNKELFLKLPDDPRKVALMLGTGPIEISAQGGVKELVDESSKKNLTVDVVFPVLHGTFGEDGTMQGLLKLANLPFVGVGVAGSAVCMDKELTKQILRAHNIPIPKFVVRRDFEDFTFDEIEEELSLPFFVKPANGGSSVGISKVHTQDEFEKAVQEAFSFDTKILFEEYIKGRELEIAALGNEDVLLSVPGEIIPTHEFYDYEAKYIDENGAILKAPADLTSDQIHEMREIAAKAFRALNCEGMARIDFFLSDSGQFYLNEVNTIPGFTKISMYPKLWELSGLSYQDLIEQLIALAFDRYEKEKKLKTAPKSSNTNYKK